MQWLRQNNTKLNLRQPPIYNGLDKRPARIRNDLILEIIKVKRAFRLKKIFFGFLSKTFDKCEH